MSASLLPSLDGRFGDGDTAVRVAGESVSWAQLARRAAAVAQHLAGMPAVAIRATPTRSTPSSAWSPH